MIVDRAWVLRDAMGRYVRWEFSMFYTPTQTLTLAQFFETREAARNYLRSHKARRGRYRILRVEVKP